MRKSSSDRRLWIEFATLTSLSIALVAFMNTYFARYKPVNTSQVKAKPVDKANAEPVRQALEHATAQIDTPKKADQAAAKLEQLAGKATTGEVEQPRQPESQGTVTAKVAESSQRVEEAAQQGTSYAEKTANGIVQTAKEITANPGPERAALSEATQETLNPETQGAPNAAHPKQRELLRRAVIKRMKPLDALDAELFLAVNRLPHAQWLNAFFYSFTLIFTGGFSWYVMIILTILSNRRLGLRAARDVVLPLTIATTLVEFPIKTYFRRRRPFIELIHAIVIGHKPGSWSFPSGHSAAAFAGALLLSRSFPERRSLNFMLASLVGFSRVYLGDHYPGDVTSGALFGMALAWLSLRVEHILLRLTGSDVK